MSRKKFDKPTDKQIEEQLQKEFQALTIYIPNEWYCGLKKILQGYLDFEVYHHSYLAPCSYDKKKEAQVGKLLSWLLIDSDEIADALEEIITDAS